MPPLIITCSLFLVFVYFILGIAQIAKNITEEYPDFKYVWMGVYSRLFRDDTEIAGLFS